VIKMKFLGSSVSGKDIATIESVGSLSIDHLSNVALTSSVLTGQVLKYDGTNWVNGAGGSGSVNTVNNVSPTTGTTNIQLSPSDIGAAPINSPNFTGTPTTATSPTLNDDSTKLATTAFVKLALGSTSTFVIDGGTF
jgi:hypothetical protein